MINRPLIILKSGLVFITCMVLLVLLVFSMADQAVDVVEHALGNGEQPTVQMVHHNMGYHTARAQPKLSITKPTTDHVTIRPLTDIYVDGPPQVVNIMAAYATLNFTSSIPVVCSVIYGSDESFGQIAQDANMNGGAIVDHRPQLTGLLANTEYHYRVQGNDANGIIYVSEVATFTTPAELTEPITEINVAALNDGAEVIDVSSNFGNADNDQTWGADNAIDENPGTAWSSNGDGNNAFIDVELTEPSALSAVEVWTRFMNDGSARISEFSISVNPHLTNSQAFGPFTLPDANQGYRFDIEPVGLATRIRLNVTESTGGNTGLVDFKVFASPTVTATSTIGSNLFLPLTVQ